MSIDPSEYSFLEIRVEEEIAFVTLNNPERANSCDEKGHSEFAAILRDIAADPAVKAGVVHGAGKAFSVGATFDWMEELTENPAMLVELQEQVRELVRAHIELSKPMVSAINGAAAGSGMMFAASVRLGHRRGTGTALRWSHQGGAGRRRRGNDDLAPDRGNHAREAVAHDG